MTEDEPASEHGDGDESARTGGQAGGRPADPGEKRSAGDGDERRGADDPERPADDAGSTGGRTGERPREPREKRAEATRGQPNEPPVNPSEQHGPDAGSQGEDGGRIGSARKVVYWATLGLVFLFGVGFTVAFYGNVTAIIDLWIADRYEIFFDTGFNLAMVLAAGIVISLILRRLEGEGTD